MILGSPESEAIHIGVSDKVYSVLNATTQTEISKCEVVESPIPIGFEILTGCARGLYGRYVYISLIRRDVDSGYFQLYEIEVYMGKSING